VLASAVAALAGRGRAELPAALAGDAEQAA
jgi:hypothetical protein